LSRQKLKETAASLETWVKPECLHVEPCRSDRDCVNYRCRCSFQIVETAPRKFRFAVRQNGRAIEIDSFAAANHRIQLAMKRLLEVLNCKDALQPRNALCHNLTSVSFSSSWVDEGNDSDCVVSLHYNNTIENEAEWKVLAAKAAVYVQLRQVTARFKGRILRALPGDATSDECVGKDDEPVLFDVLYLRKCTLSGWWTVQYGGGSPPPAGIAVHYRKPEGVFFHPNGRAMSTALGWMLNRLAVIKDMQHQNGIRMLEMYAGCGAHSMAVWKSGLVHSIDAVEINPRLVEAFRQNLVLNGSGCGSVVGVASSNGNVETSGASIRVVSADAAEWSRKRACKSINYSVLLVDPPRQGLGDTVCEMAISETSIDHILYVSCGRDALVQDLGALNNHFEVIDCLLLDLFPGTFSVESLVHLKRRCCGD
jgi:uncharacterized protein YceK